MLKRIIALLMLIACLLSLNACNTSEQLESPVAYYYLRNDVEFDGDNCVIHAEMRESAGFENNITYLLRLYLAGPSSNDYKNPFPYNVNLLSLSYENATLVATFNENFATLFGLDLTLAAVCFARTAMELSGASTVKIQREHGLLDGQLCIIIDESTVQYWDDYTHYAE